MSERGPAQGFFVTGTDTEVGKTFVTALLGRVFQEMGRDVGVMKPVQCGGDDAAFLRKVLGISDPLSEINPCYAPEPLSPHLAFARQKKRVEVSRILRGYDRLSRRHEVMLVEGAGGVMVPVRGRYLMVDLMTDLALPVIVVARAGLGTINHTLLTIEQLRARGLTVAGLILNQSVAGPKGAAEEDNPRTLQKLSGVPVIGQVPYTRRKADQREALARDPAWRASAGRLLTDQRSFPRAEQLRRWDRDYIWHPFTQMTDWLQQDPLVIDAAQGHDLIDIEGRRYLDGVASLWVNVHGHGHQRIIRAIQRQLGRLQHSTLLGLANTPSIELARKLVAITPAGLEKVFYSDNGSTAVEIGIKMAYQYWQNIGRPRKNRIAHLTNAYHGDTLGSVSVGGIDLFHKVYRRLTFKTVCWDLAKDLDGLEDRLRREHATLAAVVVEPLVQGAAGMILWPDGALKKIAALCRAYEVFLICDEVATGFGRTGRMFACEHEGVAPDILCLAKGLTGGYLPLAATLTTRKIFDGFCFDYADQKAFFHGHTYTGNPLACAAALANLEVFAKEQTLSRLQPKIRFLAKELARLTELPWVGEIRQKGFMVGIELVKDRQKGIPFDWKEKVGARVCQQARGYGVILRPLGNVIVLMPPLSISTRELRRLVTALRRAMEDVLENKDSDRF